MFVKLIKLKSNNENLRTTEVGGNAPGFPILDERFTMTGVGIVAGTRFISTSPVVAIRDNFTDHIEFDTHNSTYSLHILKK